MVNGVFASTFDQRRLYCDSQLITIAILYIYIVITISVIYGNCRLRKQRLRTTETDPTVSKEIIHKNLHFRLNIIYCI
jgi:hypothetical protein